MNETELKLYHSRNRLFFLWIFTANGLAFFFYLRILEFGYGLRYPVIRNMPIFILLLVLIFTPTLATLFLLKTKLYPIKQRLTAVVVGICTIFSILTLIFLYCFPPVKSETSQPSHYMLLDYKVTPYLEYLNELLPYQIPPAAQNVTYHYSCDATVSGFNAEIATKWTLPKNDFLTLEKQVKTNPHYKLEEGNKWQLEPSLAYYRNKVSGFVKFDENKLEVHYFAKVSEH
ncbi:MAG: hypothetical protein AB9856_01765 [Cellulosilyticaceae bacterium]